MASPLSVMEGKMKKENSNSKKKYFVMVLILAILVMATVGIFYYINVWKDQAASSSSEEQPGSSVDGNELAEGYILETSFNGEDELDPVVFQFPFQKSDYYVMNKELVKKVDSERISAIRSRAEEVVKGIYGINKSDVTINYDKYENLLDSFFLEDSIYRDEADNMKSSDDNIADFLLLLSNAGIQLEIDYTSSDCLVWSDIAYYVRGVMEFTVYDIDESVDISAYFPTPLKKGESYKAVIDLGLVPESSRKAETFKVCDIDWMDCQMLVDQEQGSAENIIVK